MMFAPRQRRRRRHTDRPFYTRPAFYFAVAFAVLMFFRQLSAWDVMGFLAIGVLIFARNAHQVMRAARAFGRRADDVTPADGRD